jgi:glycosyltransferase involved in cell wall biosynthesis
MFGSLPAEFGGNGRGGVAVHTGKIAEALTEAGEAVTVLADDVSNGAQIHATAARPFPVIPYASPRKTEAIALLIKHRFGGWPSSAAPRSLGRLDSLWVVGYAPAYYELIRGLSPDIVHIHGVGLRVLAVQRAAALMPAPLVLTVHSLRGHVPDETFFARSVPSLLVADALITVSRHLKSEAVSYGAEASRVHVIPNGVDRSTFTPIGKEEARRKLGLSHDGPIVLLVAHLIERKGADLAIRAMQKVVSRNPTAKLYLIGAPQSYTDSGWRERLVQLPGALGIERQVVFLGDVPGHGDGQLNLWYNAADIVVLPSRAEGMGMVLIEAMACGTPVIGTRVGGIPDVVTDRSNGLLVPPEDSDSLAAAILEALGNRELRQCLAEAGLRRVRQEHDWDVIARQTQGVYAAVLQRRTGV